MIETKVSRNKIVRYGTHRDFTKIKVLENGQEEQTIYGYGWMIYRIGYWWYAVWDPDVKKPPVEIKKRARTQDAAMAYCRVHPVPGCSCMVRPSYPIENALQA